MTTLEQLNAPTKPATPCREAGLCRPATICSPSRLHLDLFSGIGGFALAARNSGWQTIALSEIEPYACKLLAKHFPGIPNLGDIRALRGIPCDLITGGFPCQPYSLAGKRGGAGDDRALWPEMLRVIGESKPRWVLGENVPGIISMELDGVLSDLENIGYSAWPIAIPACGVDARHRRERIWIVAHSERSEGRQRRVTELQRRRKGEAKQTRLGGRTVSDAAGERRENGCRIHSGISGAAAGTTQPETLGEFWRWPTEPELGRVADGIPNRSHRLRGLGNAIVPQVAETLMREMVRMENVPDQRPGESPKTL